MAKEITAAQGTDEWRSARVGIATASRFASVMAKIKTGEAADRRNYRADLIVERLTGKPLESFTTKAMQQGIEREPFARMAYEAATGEIVREVGFFRHDTIEAGASPDGIVCAGIGLEIKCPERSTHLAYLKSKTEPSEYSWQIQGQMWVCELEAVDFVSYNPDFPENLQLVIRRVKRNDEAIKQLADEVAKFMDEVRAEEAEIRSMKVAA